jgi:hypothetical protein
MTNLNAGRAIRSSRPRKLLFGALLGPSGQARLAQAVELTMSERDGRRFAASGATL